MVIVVVGFVLFVGVVAALQVVYRKVWKTLLSVPLLLVFFLLAFAVSVLGDVGGEAAYWARISRFMRGPGDAGAVEDLESSTKPIVVLLSSGGSLMAGVQAEVSLIARMAKVATGKLEGTPEEQLQKRKEMLEDFARNSLQLSPDVATDERGFFRREGLLHVYSKFLPAVAEPDLAELRNAQEADDWEGPTQKYHRILVLNLDRAREGIESLDRVEIALPKPPGGGAGGEEGSPPQAEGNERERGRQEEEEGSSGGSTIVLRKKAILDCLPSPDCGDTLYAALRTPSLFIESVEGETDVEGYLFVKNDYRSLFDRMEGLVPGYPHANTILAIAAMALPLRNAPKDEVLPMALGLGMDLVKGLQPKTPIVGTLEILISNMPPMLVEYLEGRIRAHGA